MSQAEPVSLESARRRALEVRKGFLEARAVREGFRWVGQGFRAARCPRREAWQ